MLERPHLGLMEKAGDLHVRRTAGQQVVELVRVRVILRMLAWRARDAQGVPLLEQCLLDALLRGRPVQIGHVFSLAWRTAPWSRDYLKWCLGRQSVKMSETRHRAWIED